METIKKGDLVKIDFVGKINGIIFEGGSAKDYYLTIGSNEFIKGFEKQLIGKKVGDEFDIVVSFPNNYHDKSLANKPATFSVKVKYIIDTSY